MEAGMGEVKSAAGLPSGPLRERVKELECLQASSRSSRSPGLSSEKIIQGSSTPSPRAGSTRTTAGARIQLPQGRLLHPRLRRNAAGCSASPCKPHGGHGRLARGLLFRQRARSAGRPLPARGEEAHRADREAARPPVRGVGGRRSPVRRGRAPRPPKPRKRKADGRSSWTSSGRPTRCSTTGSCGG